MDPARAAAPGRAFVALAAAVLLLGIADSMVGAYLVLYAADEAGLDPVRVGLFAAAPAVGGIVISALLARRFDARPSRAYAIGVAVTGAIGYGLLATTRSFPVMIVVAVVLLGAVSAAFPQLFALGRLVLGNDAAGRRSAPLLRSAWSLAWAAGPLLGAAVVAVAGYPALLVSAAAVLLATAVAVAAVPRPSLSARHGPPNEATGRGTPGRLTVALLTAGVFFFFTAMFAGSIALPLFVTRQLDQPDAVVGVLYSACAVVEVVAALALAALPSTFGQRAVIAGGMLVFVGFFAVTVVAGGLPLLLVGQVARGVGIAIVGAAGIRYFQDVMAGSTGRATTLFSNASTAGSLVAGLAAGVSTAVLGSSTTLLLCGGTALLAAVVFLAASGPLSVASR